MIDKFIFGLGFGLGVKAAEELKERMRSKFKIHTLKFYNLNEMIMLLTKTDRVPVKKGENNVIVLHSLAAAVSLKIDINCFKKVVFLDANLDIDDFSEYLICLNKNNSLVKSLTFLESQYNSKSKYKIYNHTSLQNISFIEYLSFAINASNSKMYQKKIESNPDKFVILDTCVKNRKQYQYLSEISNLDLNNHTPFFGEEADQVIGKIKSILEA